MDRLRQDLIVSLRRLRRTPAFTIAAVLTLALGIGANTTVFTAVNTLLFRPLPVDRPNELAYLNLRAGNQEVPTLSYPDYVDFRDRNDVFAGLILYRIAPVNFRRGSGNGVRVWSYEVSGNYFNVLGISAWRGRLIQPDDDRNRGAHPVVVLSYSCWQRRFAGDPGVVGQNVKLNGLDYIVIGVAPAGFFGTEVIYTPEIWVPVAMEAQIEPGNSWLDRRGARNSFVLGRLKPGVGWRHAEAAINAIADDLGRQYPDTDAGMKIALSPPGLVGNFIRGAVNGFAGVLMATAGLVLLIACVNLASLLLARASDRRKETALRLALGASRGQLVRELLTESSVLSVAGGGAGLLLAVWLADLFAAWRPPVEIPVFPALSIDIRVTAFAAAVSLLTGIVFGLAPALQSTRGQLTSALKNEAAAVLLRRWPVRDLLVGVQVALSVVLLAGSVLVLRSLQHALSLPIGFEPQHAATVSFDLSLQGYDRGRGLEFQRRLVDNVRSLPGIESAGLISGLPLTLNINNNGVFIEGKPVLRAADVPSAAMYWVSPGYLRTARTRLLAGRDFDARDREGAHRVAIVNQAFARELLPGDDPIGKRFRYSSTTQEWIQIVGVVENGKYRSLGESPMPAVFNPLEQFGGLGTSLVARSPMPEAETVAALRRAVAELDPALPVSDAGSLTDALGLALFPARVAAIVLGAFGLLAIVLASTGMYGIVAYAVSRRTREIGIRMTLGATSYQVARTVLGRTAILLAAGTFSGSALALAASQFSAPVLYGISSSDPATYVIAIALMSLVAVVACWFPSRQATRVQPATALRTE